jgi:hypothetical protein
MLILAALVGGLIAACGLALGGPSTDTPAAPALPSVAPATAQPAPATAQPTPSSPNLDEGIPVPMPVPTQPGLIATPTMPGPALPISPNEAVNLLLTQAGIDVSLQSALPYLGPNLRDRVQAGQLDAGSLLMMQNPFSSYMIEREYGDTQGNAYVDVSLFFGGATTDGAGRIFALSNAEGSWRVVAVTDAAVIPPPPPPWPGPGWALVVEGDLTGDGVSESVYCAPGAITPIDGFGDPQLDSASTVCTEVMISSPLTTPTSEYTILLRATLKELVAADGILGAFASPEKPGGAMAHRLAVTPGAKVSVHLLPLNPDGTAYAQGVGVYWNAAAGAFRFAGPDIWGTP